MVVRGWFLLEIVIVRDWRRLYVYENGSIVEEYPVAVGRPSLPTPLGTYRVAEKQLNPGGAFGVRWLGLSAPGYGIHGTNDVSSIGKSISHGCVRMYNPDVIELYDRTEIGTIVRIISSPEILPDTYQRPTGRPYEVEPGDTLYQLAQRFNVNVEAIYQRNHLQNTRGTIYPGQMLIIPTL